MHHHYIIYITVICYAIFAAIIITAAYRTFIFHQKQEEPKMDADLTAEEIAEENAIAEAYAKVVAKAKAEAKANAEEEVEKHHPARNDGHAHVFTSGLAPGGRNIRSCTVAGCGYTEGL